jgi:hypothetical protein
MVHVSGQRHGPVNRISQRCREGRKLYFIGERIDNLRMRWRRMMTLIDEYVQATYSCRVCTNKTTYNMSLPLQHKKKKAPTLTSNLHAATCSTLPR